MLVTGTACLCLICVVLGAVLGVLTGKVSVAALGNVAAGGTGAGLLGFAYVLFKIIKISVAGRGA